MINCNIDIIRHDYLGIYSNSFVLSGRDFRIFVDSGLDGNAGLLAPYCDGAPLVLLATHGHWDHIGLHAYLKSRGARLYAASGDRRYLEDFRWHWRDLFGQYEEDFDLPAARRTVFSESIGSPVTIDAAVADGSRLDFGDVSLEVIATPGHSDGSVCYFDADRGRLFTGDSLMGAGFFSGIPQYTDPYAYINSMKRLADYRPETVYSCHNAPIDGALLADRAHESILTAERIMQTVEDYVKAPPSGRVSLREAVALTCDTLGKKVGGGACVTVMAHFALLAERYPVLAPILQKHAEYTEGTDNV